MGYKFKVWAFSLRMRGIYDFLHKSQISLKKVAFTLRYQNYSYEYACA